MLPRTSPHVAPVTQRRLPPLSVEAAPAAPARRAERRQRACLSDEIDALDQALSAPAAATDWREAVGVRLHGLRVAFGEHIVLTEGSDGLYAELSGEEPRLARTVHLLTREHTAIAAQMAALQDRIASREFDIDQLRQRGVELLGELSRHRQHGADLIYEAYATDLGGED